MIETRPPVAFGAVRLNHNCNQLPPMEPIVMKKSFRMKLFRTRIIRVNVHNQPKVAPQYTTSPVRLDEVYR